MTEYEQNRARHLCVPGGSIRLPRCLCEHATLTPAMIEHTDTRDGVEWNYYPVCPVHGIRAIEPVMTGDMKPATTLAGKARVVSKELSR